VHPYRIRPAVDLPVLGLGLAFSMLAFIELAPVPKAETGGIRFPDRLALGNHAPAAFTVADVLVHSLLVVALAAELLRSSGRWVGAFLLIQTLAIAQGFTQWSKSAVRRAAPVVYHPDAPAAALMHFEATRSYLSGHAATAFAAVAFLVASMHLRPTPVLFRRLALAVALPVAVIAGILKVVAGYHFPTDVLAGALVGASVGVLVPVLHRRDVAPI
jgi:membrane-associated phospholipid phosphatase